jgi:hypothetical protein
VHATPTTPISPTGLCPHRSTGRTLLKIPAAGTENDDHNPPRIAPRNLFDVAVGHDNIFGGDRYKWSARLTVVNLTNKEALYNFLSTFSGTHYVTPRAITATLGFHFCPRRNCGNRLRASRSSVHESRSATDDTRTK